MLKIPFQDTRSGANRRWTDHLKQKQIRLAEIIDVIHCVDALDRQELLEVQANINRKLEAFGKAD